MYYLIPIIVAVIAIVIFAAYYFNKRMRIRRLMKKAPLTSIRKARSGEYMRIVGEVDFLKEPLQAPVSKRDCAFFHLVVEREQQNGRNTYWNTLFEEKVKNPFIIRERDYTAVVNVDSVEAWLYPDKKFTPQLFNKADEELDRYLKTKEYEVEGALGFHKSIRYKEGVLEKGEKVCVTGKCSWVEQSDLVPNTKGRILYIQADTNRPVYITDDPVFLKQSAEEKKDRRGSRERRRR